MWGVKSPFHDLPSVKELLRPCFSKKKGDFFYKFEVIYDRKQKTCWIWRVRSPGMCPLARKASVRTMRSPIAGMWVPGEQKSLRMRVKASEKKMKEADNGNGVAWAENEDKVEALIITGRSGIKLTLQWRESLFPLLKLPFFTQAVIYLIRDPLIGTATQLHNWAANPDNTVHVIWALSYLWEWQGIRCTGARFAHWPQMSFTFSQQCPLFFIVVSAVISQERITVLRTFSFYKLRHQSHHVTSCCRLI